MPTVPRSGIAEIQNVNSKIRVSEAAPIEAFGGGISKVANQAADLMQKMKTRADEVALMEAERKMNEEENSLMYGSGEKDEATGEVKNRGIAFLKGKDAFEVPKYANERFSKARDSIYNSLSNPSQKAMFEERAQQRKIQLDKSVSRHVSNEIQKYEDETTQSYLKSEQDLAIKNYQDPQRVAQSIYNQKQTVLKYAERNGLDPETTKFQVQNVESKTHAEVISRMLTNGDDLTAQAYYAQNKDFVTGEHIESVEKELELGSTMGFAQRFTDDVMRKGFNQQQAFERTSQIENPKLREAAEQRVSRQFALKEQAKKQYEQQTVDNLASYFDENGEFPASATKAIASLSDEAKTALAAYRDRNPLRDDGEVFTRLKQLAENPKTREKFMNHDMWKERPNLNKAHYESLLKYQADLKSGGGKGAKELDGAFSDSQVIQAVYESAGMNPKNKEDYAKFKNAVDSEIIKYKADHGKVGINNNDLRKIAKDLTVKEITEKGLFWDSKKPRYLIEPSSTNSVADINPDKKDELVAKLKTKKIPVTDENLLYYYNRMSGK